MNTESSSDATRHLPIRCPRPIAQKIEQVPGVVGCSPSNWFGGIYKEDKPQYTLSRSFSSIRKLSSMFNLEIQISPQEKAAFQQERTAAIVGKEAGRQVRLESRRRGRVARRHTLT